MSVRPDSPLALFGPEGELVLLRISVEPRFLEDLLEALSSLDFPVNPQLYHGPGQVSVEFPAYSANMDRVRQVLGYNGFDPQSLHLSAVLTLAQGA